MALSRLAAEYIESVILSAFADRARALGFRVTKWKRSDEPDPLGEGYSMAHVELTRVEDGKVIAMPFRIVPPPWPEP